jgi:hypothetical protein
MARPERRLAIALGERLLDGVGDRPVRVDPSERVIHVRAPLTAIEEAGMPSWWADFQPVDGAGVGGLLDEMARRR